jgi:opacity protein-like surface antigen
VIADSGHSVGWEVGAGISFGLGDAWRLSPGLRYRSFSPELDVAATTTDVDLRYVALELGMTWSL